ncbi:extracellular solute-binding protein family 1 [Kribbella flavida DSM 17836]|uniref:Extracellular solute-binding protein family 1 n=1 Tax=Kribbella flavida (strain DSM 17836 / JCM 10339 / NBRC 14399) TaxID=479435 RepID=D2PWR7_KRIFD|nr:sugar ABC transporter substrate-binding protein [Kribbella flavida]ADB33536.1 extracellular solute-binding protein family 1 [Kribbella flavida DSM 17836]
MKPSPLTRRHFLGLGATTGVAAAGLAAGCSPAGDAGGTSRKDADDGGKPVTLSFWKPPGLPPPDENKFFQQLTGDFGQSHGNDVVKHLLLPWDDAFTKYTAAFGGGTPPDVSYLILPWINQFGTAGGLAPLSDIDPGLDLSGVNQNAVDSAKIDGKLYGVPWYSSRVPLALNEAVWEKAGKPPLPKTYVELAEFVKLLTFDKAGRALADPRFDRRSISTYGMAWPGLWEVQANYLWNYLWAYGVDYISEDRKNVGFDNEQGRAALQQLRQIQESGAATPMSLYADPLKWEDMIWTGRAAVQWTSPPRAEKFKKHPTTRLKVLDLPSGPAGQFMIGGVGYLCIAAKSKYPETALEFIKRATSDDAVKRYLQQTLLFPIKDSVDGSIYSAVSDRQPRQFLLDTLAQGKYLRLTKPLPFNAEEYLAGEINNFVSGQKDLDKMIKDASKQIGTMARNAGL